MGFIFTSASLALHFDTVILIGMVLAFLLNAFFYISDISKNLSLLLTSFLMAASYYTSNHFITLGDDTTYIYLRWVAYDLFTVSAILIANKLMRLKKCIAAKYVIFGLLANALLCLMIHIDMRILENQDPWWFWYFYTLAINTIDVIMVAALILDRDFLGVKFIKHRVKKHFSKKQRTIST
ncbi:hypothetical protein [Pseudoalteromonas phenolica]|uniref:hypothetical protein n=1 Tax=Pseudoalteromonas phenolica TaxID=161398 RepID=UPI0038508AB1